MTRILLAAFAGLILGGIVHIVTLFGVPLMAERDAYQRLGALAPENAMALLPERGGAAEMPFTDPAFVVAACRFDLTKGPVAVSVPVPDPYAAVSFHTRYGDVFYAVNDRAASSGVVEIEVIGAGSVEEFAAPPTTPDAAARAVLRIVSPTDTGFVLARALVPSESDRPRVHDEMAKGRCGVVERVNAVPEPQVETVPEPKPRPTPRRKREDKTSSNRTTRPSTVIAE